MKIKKRKIKKKHLKFYDKRFIKMSSKLKNQDEYIDLYLKVSSKKDINETRRQVINKEKVLGIPYYKWKKHFKK